MRVMAYAKINLDLRILGRRPDSYHEIRTLMQTVELHDELVVRRRRSAGIKLECSGMASIPRSGANLVYRAAERVISRHCPDAGVMIKLTKRIPMGAGLGGGSSDAAAVLRVLDKLLELGLSEEEQSSLAAGLGSDVPFFLHGGLCVASGRGEKVQPLASRRRLGVVIAFPRIHVATADAYRWYAETSGGRSADAAAPCESTRRYVQSSMRCLREDNWGWFTNDLEGAVFKMHPSLREIKQTMLTEGAIHAAMTGSGSAVFGIFSRYHIDSALTAVRRRHRVPVVLTRLLSDRRRATGI